MKFVPCIAWVRRGVPSSTPHKVKLSKDDMKQLLQGASAISAESSESDAQLPSAVSVTKAPQHLRGSRVDDDSDSSSDSDQEDQDADPDKRYAMDKYDQDEESEKDAHLKGLAVFANNEDDPYVAIHDSDEDDEDFKLKPDDNLLLACRVAEDEHGLEVYVYNENDDSFYVHHDYSLVCPPICIEPIGYDPGAEQEGGNLCAVGGLAPFIQLWDLDIVECMEPVGVLGNDDENEKRGRKKKSKKGAKADVQGQTSSVEPKKKKKKTISHTDAILDLAWNRQRPHILASSSADTNVILWDIDVGQGSNVLSNHSDKVQTLKWHPVEDSLLLSGGCDGLINLWDCRQCTSQRQWSISSGEIEKVQWNSWDPFRFFASSDTGDILSIDSRQESIRSEDRLEKAHEEAVTGLALHSTMKNCLATCGVDGLVKIWRAEIGGEKPLRLVSKKKLKLGKLFCCSFCPDNPWLLAVGGESEEGVYLRDIRKDAKVAREFEVVGATSGERESSEEGEGDEEGNEEDEASE